METISSTSQPLKIIKRRTSALKTKPIKTITEIKNNLFQTSCSTQTFIARFFGDKIKLSIDELEKVLEIQPSSNEHANESKFRNCVMKKIRDEATNKDRVCIKLYTNLTIQMVGVKSMEEFLTNMKSINFENIPLVPIKYYVECVMSNWIVVISVTPINIQKTMVALNTAGILAYFLRGYPLIVKYKSEKTYQSYVYEDGKFTSALTKPIQKMVSVSIFKSGSCIVSGVTEESAVECIQEIKKYLVIE